MALTSLRSWPRLLAPVAVAAMALAIRLAAAPGADLDATLQEILGRAPRLDAYWYTRAAVDAARGEPAPGVSRTFDRPLYTLACRATYAVAGATERTLPLPAILAGALGAGVLVVIGWEGGLGGAAVLAGVFAATNWLAVAHDREPLVYSTVNLAFLLSLLAWVRGLRSPRWLAVGWAGIGATAVWGKETVLLAVPALLLGHLMLAGGTRRSRLRAAAVLAGASALAAAAAWLAAPGACGELVQKVAARAAFSDIRFPGGWVLALGDLPKTLAVLGRIPAIAALAAIGIAAVLLEGRNETGDSGHAFRRVLVVWLVLGCAIVAGFSYRPTRYVLGLFAPAFLLAAHAVRVLWGGVPSPVRAGPAARVALLGVTWWVGLAALYSWLAALLPDPVRHVLPAVLWAPAFRLGVSAAAATAIALGQAASLGERGRFGPSRRYAAALAAFVLLTDARAFRAHLFPARFDDVAARRSFEAAVGPGARVMGYAAHFLAFDARYRVAQEFRVDPASLLANPTGSTHLATLWVPELDYVERLMAAAGAPLHRITDVVIGRERYRVYRLAGAEARGYAPTAFERARLREDAGDVAGADEAYRRVVAAGASDPLVLAAAGAALTALAPDEGRALLVRARDAAPRNGLVWLLDADAAAAAGRTAEALSLRARAAALLPHELVIGFGPQPLSRAF
jgi:hypothetical protein